MSTGDLPDDLVQMYWKRVARQCARDHANRDFIELAQMAIEEHNNRNAEGTNWNGFSPDYFRELIKDYMTSREDNRWGHPRCLPWPCIRLEDMRLVYNTKSDCFISVEVTYGTQGERAIYGIAKDNGQAYCWAD